jgi:acylphosphatase
VVAEGTPEALLALEQWCRTGPPAAKVSSVDVEHEPTRDEFSGFNIR